MVAASQEDVLSALAGLPPLSDPGLTPQLASRVLKNWDRNSLRSALVAIIEDPRLDLQVRTLAFFGLHLHLRRYKDLNDLFTVTNKYRPLLANEEIWPFLESMTLYYCDYSRQDLARAESLARQVMERLPQHYFALAHYAMVVARRLKRDGLRDGDELRDVIKVANDAIRLSGGEYARFWSVMAELLIVAGRFDEADHAISRAIELEDSETLDYAVRLSDYQTIRIESQVARHRLALDQADAAAAQRLDQMRSELLGMLGLLAALIAFITSSVQIAVHTDADAGIKVLMACGGVLAIVFSAYSTIFQPGNLWGKVAAAIVGAALLCVSIFL